MTSLIDEDTTADLTADLAPQSLGAQPSERPRPKQQTPVPDPQPIAKTGSITPAKGVTLRDRYVLEEQIASGGTSVIFRARDLRRTSESATPAHLAIKVLRPELRTNASAIERLKREFRHAQSLSHPNIVRVFDLDCEGEHWFMTMELLEGESLSALLRSGPATLPSHRVSHILRGCGEALNVAHERGVVHGDFKPGNVFVLRNAQIRVLDFGAATSTAPSGEEHFPAATLCYASPEILSGLRPERRDDIFSFACVAYELLNGKHPFDRRSSLEAHTRHLAAPRAWNLNDRQWFPLEAALSFRRDGRPANIRSLIDGLLSSGILPPIAFPLPTELPSITAPAREYHPRAPRKSAPPLAQAAQQFRAPPRVLAPPRLQPARLQPEIEPQFPPPEFASPVARPTGTSGARALTNTVAAMVTLALVAVVAYSRVQQNPQELTQLRERVSAWIGGSAPYEAPARAEPSASMPATSELSAPTSTAAVPAVTPAKTRDRPSLPEIELRTAPASRQTNPKQQNATAPRIAAVPQVAPAPQRRPSVESLNSTVPRRAFTPPPVGPRAFISFDDASITVSEGAGAAVLTLRREQQLSGRALVHWRVIPGSALPGQDYIEGAAGMTEFPDGHNRRAIYVPLLTDAIAEPREYFTVELYDASENAQIWPIARATVQIVDDDRPIADSP